MRVLTMVKGQAATAASVRDSPPATEATRRSVAIVGAGGVRPPVAVVGVQSSTHGPHGTPLPRAPGLHAWGRAASRAACCTKQRLGPTAPPVIMAPMALIASVPSTCRCSKNGFTLSCGARRCGGWGGRAAEHHPAVQGQDAAASFFRNRVLLCQTAAPFHYSTSCTPWPHPGPPINDKVQASVTRMRKCRPAPRPSRITVGCVPRHSVLHPPCPGGCTMPACWLARAADSWHAAAAGRAAAAPANRAQAERPGAFWKARCCTEAAMAAHLGPLVGWC